MSLKHGILGLLTIRPMSGYDLMKMFEQSLAFFWSAQTSQIYRDLDALAGAGLAELHEEVQRGKQLKTIYSITDAGRKELQDWLSAGTGDAGGFKSVFLLKLFFQNQAGLASLKKLVEEKKAQAEKTASELRAVHTALTSEQHPKDDLAILCWSMTAEYGAMQFETEARWAEGVLARLNEAERKES